MRRLIAGTLLLATTALLAFSSWLPTNPSASSGQGKGGEVVTKPTPMPVLKKTTPKRRTPSRTTTNSNTSRPAKSTTDSAAAAEMLFWNSIKDSTSPEDFKAYLRKYPNGQFVDLARNRLNALETAAKEAAARKEETRLKEEKAKKAEARRKELEGLRRRIGMEFVMIRPGSFMMGSTFMMQLLTGETLGADEKPVHRVTINYSFYIGKYEVTQAQWQEAMGSNPSHFKDCGNCPVEDVSWDDAQRFIDTLSEGDEGFTYRLPSEAEWEYACRAGTTTDFAFGGSLSSDQANFNGNYPYGGAAPGVYRQKTTAVGSFAPNTFGLYDMHGNVSEWCEDLYHNSYNGAPTDGTAWLSGGGKYHVIRGGSWSGVAVQSLRSSSRDGFGSLPISWDYGFRVVKVVRTQ